MRYTLRDLYNLTLLLRKVCSGNQDGKTVKGQITR